MTFGEYIVERRNILNIMQKDLAKAMNISVSALSKIEHDKGVFLKQDSFNILCEELAIKSTECKQWYQMEQGRFPEEWKEYIPDIVNFIRQKEH